MGIGIPQFRAQGFTVRCDHRRVLELSATGAKPAEIATELGVSARTVFRVLSKAGLTRHHQGLPVETTVRMGELLADGASYAEVSRTLNVAAKTVQRKYPGLGWSHAQRTEYVWAKRKLASL